MQRDGLDVTESHGRGQAALRRGLRQMTFQTPAGSLGSPRFALDGLDVIEGNEGDFGSLICEA